LQVLSLLDQYSADMQGPNRLKKLLNALLAKEYLKRWKIYLSTAAFHNSRANPLFQTKRNIPRFSSFHDPLKYNGKIFSSKQFSYKDSYLKLLQSISAKHTESFRIRSMQNIPMKSAKADETWKA
jgi:hypothetical protein